MSKTYTFTDEQWQQISSALNVAISVCMMHEHDFMGQMLDASNLMDDIANAEPQEPSHD